MSASTAKIKIWSTKTTSGAAGNVVFVDHKMISICPVDAAAKLLATD